MLEFLSVVKTLIVTMIVVVCLQIKVGGESLENKSYYFLTQSTFASHLHGVAKGTIKATQDGWTWLINSSKPHVEKLRKQLSEK